MISSTIVPPLLASGEAATSAPAGAPGFAATLHACLAPGSGAAVGGTAPHADAADGRAPAADAGDGSTGPLGDDAQPTAGDVDPATAAAIAAKALMVVLDVQPSAPAAGDAPATADGDGHAPAGGAGQVAAAGQAPAAGAGDQAAAAGHPHGVTDLQGGQRAGADGSAAPGPALRPDTPALAVSGAAPAVGTGAAGTADDTAVPIPGASAPAGGATDTGAAADHDASTVPQTGTSEPAAGEHAPAARHTTTAADTGPQRPTTRGAASGSDALAPAGTHDVGDAAPTTQPTVTTADQQGERSVTATPGANGMPVGGHETGPRATRTEPVAMDGPAATVAATESAAPASGASTTAGTGATAEASAPRVSQAVARVTELVERLRMEPPPRQMVIDLDQFGAGRLVVSLRADTVVIDVPDAGPRLDAQWWQELGEALDERGWSLDARDGGDQRHRHGGQPHDVPVPVEPVERIRRRGVPADDGLRL